MDIVTAAAAGWGVPIGVVIIVAMVVVVVVVVVAVVVTPPTYLALYPVSASRHDRSVTPVPR